MCKSNPDRIFNPLRLLLLVSLLLALSACNQQQARQYVVNTAVVTSALTDLDSQFEVTASQIEGLPVFTSEELATLRKVKGELNQLRQKVHNLVSLQGGLAQVLIDAEQVRSLYETGAHSYRLARTNILAHWDELPLPVQVKLDLYDQRAKALQQAINQLMAQPGTQDITPIIRDILTVGAATAKLLLATGAL